MKNKLIYILGSVIFIVDQLTKMFIEGNTKIIEGFLYINPVNNYGAAWSIFSNQTIFLIIVSIIMLLVLFRYQCYFIKNLRNRIGFGLLYGGLLGNLLDRIIFGYVRDFIDTYVFGYDFPVFNVADMAVVIGVILLIVAIIKGEDKVEKTSHK